MVGGYLLEAALQRGYRVRALARNPAKLAPFSSRITIITGDARDPAVVRELVQGSDVVISALGPVKADGDASRLYQYNGHPQRAGGDVIRRNFPLYYSLRRGSRDAR